MTFSMNHDRARWVAAVSGFLAISLGAFGAHMFKTKLEAGGMIAVWQTAVLYHLVHSVVLLVLSGWKKVPRFAFLSIFFGVLLFSGSLYLLALVQVRWLGAVTPLGGVGMLAGWLGLAFGGRDQCFDSKH
jgi:uncharacterized membrane protein YgdD (TMEM256/DUF423 family)